MDKYNIIRIKLRIMKTRFAIKRTKKKNNKTYGELKKEKENVFPEE